MSEEMKSGFTEKMPRESVQVRTQWKDPKHQTYHDDIEDAIKRMFASVRARYQKAVQDAKNEGAEHVIESIQKAHARELNQVVAEIPAMVIGYFNRKGAFLSDARDTARLNWLEEKMQKGEIAIGWDEDEDAPFFDLTTEDVEGDYFKNFRDMIDNYMLREKDS